jgi:D-cysteine desulfhydrase
LRSSPKHRVADLPLLRRFPALGKLPRAQFGSYPTPIDQLTLDDGRRLLIKRDDRSGAVIGGNKVRGLEWLLGGVSPNDRVLTVGPRGSTHALSTALCARELGAQVTVVRWNQVMNDAARRVAARLEASANVIDAHWVPAAYVVATATRLLGRKWIPAGGATPLALLGHVNAGMELAEQVAADECPLPERIVVPFGTGGTAAGLALGLRLSGLGSQLVAVRVVPRLLGSARRLMRLAHATAKLLERLTGERIPRIAPSDILVEHEFYAGAYGRPLDVPREVGDAASRAGIRLDDTYSHKAFAAALAQRDHLTLFWLTFDGRLLGDG